jgi:receptor expression-enhancing protein 5/6
MENEVLQKLEPLIANHLNRLDETLAKFPQAVAFESRTKLRKSLAALCLALIISTLILLNFQQKLIANLLGFAYPCYRSFEAVQSQDGKEDRKLLIYWIVFSTLNIIEFFSRIVPYFVPQYYLLKSLFVVYLMLKQTRVFDFLIFRALKWFIIRWWCIWICKFVLIW